MCILHLSLIDCILQCYFLGMLDWISLRMYYKSNCTESHVINYIIHFNAGINKKMLRHEINRLEVSLSSGPFTDNYSLP